MEIWRPIKNFEGYLVSDQGRVKTHKFKMGRSGGGIKVVIDFDREGFVLKPSSNHGYLRVTLWQASQPSTIFIHRLVLEAFVGPPKENEFCCHLDGSRNNNQLSNLIWGSLKLNASHKKLHGTHQWGEKNPMHVLKLHQVKEIKSLRYKYTGEQVAHRFKVSPTTIGRIWNHKNWKYA